MNNKGDIPSILFAIIAIFIIGISLLFVNHFTKAFYGEIDQYLDQSEKYNTTEITEPFDDIQRVENSRIYDYAFLAVVFGYFMSLALVGYSTRISPLFFWIYGVIAIIGVMLAVMLANTWQELAADPAFSETITRFPITDLLLGSYYPLFATIMIVVVMIFLFGKFPGGGEV